VLGLDDDLGSLLYAGLVSKFFRNYNLTLFADLYPTFHATSCMYDSLMLCLAAGEGRVKTPRISRIEAYKDSFGWKWREFGLHKDEACLLKRFNLLLCDSSIVQLRDE